ncbi:hypothetical protein [Rhodanobacter sp. DHB23]|uniref:hypothetical protein n=1 Tax=Rhodanobacter sp. DHB23 TaxID=2775923 RepID=UPI00177E25E6|nr:hypothetical protein [Rhodanobacter sp. DHB23]MBD8873536.1 hypothetical protein [Rhodanobacter sp. DHB23]
MKRTFALFLAVVLAACSKSPGGVSAVPGAASNLPTADLSTPDSAYVPVTQARQVWVMYDALSGDKPSDMMLWAIDPSLMGADPFEKKDKVAQLLPQLHAEMATAKDHRYIVWVDHSGRLAPYNFDHHAFGFASALMNPPAMVTHGQIAGVSLIDVAPTNTAAFEWLRVPDETQARAIQARLSAGWIPQVKVWAYVQGATKVKGITQALLVQITKVQVLDPQGQVVLEQTQK